MAIPKEHSQENPQERSIDHFPKPPGAQQNSDTEFSLSGTEAPTLTSHQYYFLQEINLKWQSRLTAQIRTSAQLDEDQREAFIS